MTDIRVIHLLFLYCYISASVKPAFFATLSHTQNLGFNNILKFNNVKTNIANGYNSAIGMFTARAAGAYEFNASFKTVIIKCNNWGLKASQMCNILRNMSNLRSYPS